MSTSMPKQWLESANGTILSAEEVPAPSCPEELKTILLVDDDPVTLTVCGGCLEEAGYKVLKAKSAQEAIRLCEQHTGSIHLLLTDYVLAPQTLQLRQPRRGQQTVMNGLQLMREITAMRPEVQVIVMSGHTDASLESLYRLKSGRPFLRKPFNLDTLVRVVHDSLYSPVRSETAIG